ncbi:MAG: hypothetical protein RIC16_03690 [Rhodospirillales bacterium]
MSTPVPPPLQTPPPTATGGNTPTITLGNPPTVVSSLPIGSTLQATVAAVQAGNQLQLATAFGALQGTANVPLKVDTPLTLQILPKPPSAQTVYLQIVEVAGRPLAATANAAVGKTSAAGQGIAGQPAAAPVTQAAAIAPATVTLSVGQIVSAVMLQPLSTAATPGSATQAPTTGAASTTPTATPPSQSANPAAPASNTPAATTRPTPAGTAPTPGSSGSALVPGTRLTLGIVSVSPTPASAPIAASTPAPLPPVGGTFTGLVVGTTPSGQPLVQTPVGQITVEQAPPLAKGAEIVFRVETAPQSPAESVRIGSETNQAQLARGYGWPALEELSALLNERAPGLGDRVAHLITPQADAKLGSTLLFLLSALKAGDLKSWLGETGMRELSRLRPDAMRRLGDDVRLLAGTADEADSRPVRTGDWRAFPLPLFGEGMEQSRLLVRRDPSEEETEVRKSSETRFVVDLTLTSIGRLQLDGLIDTGDRRFDMLVRTTAALPARFRGDILQIFASANETIGMSGGLAFRASPDALIDTTDKPQKPPRDSGLVV